MRDRLPKNPSLKDIVKFPWDERWLRGYEYEYILRNYKLYQKKFGISVYSHHPLHVYSKPKNGEVYIIERMHLRQFGFPRMEGFDKKIKWKKMNFTTDLPKINPQVKYLVSSGKLGLQCFRMHVVVLANEYKRKDSIEHVNQLMESQEGKIHK